MDRKDSFTKIKIPKPYLLPTDNKWNPTEELNLRREGHPLPNGTLGDIGSFTRVSGPDRFPQSILVIPYDPQQLKGIDAKSIRVFKKDYRKGSFSPVWNSGINCELKYIWVKIKEPGVYLPIGLPRDRVLQESIRNLGYERAIENISDPEHSKSLVYKHFNAFLEKDEKKLEHLRLLVTKFELDTTNEIPLEELKMGQGGHQLTFHLPKGVEMEEFSNRIAELEIPPEGLPEEALLNPLEFNPGGNNAWPINPDAVNFERFRDQIFELDPDILVNYPIFFSKDWSMYQHDKVHSGVATGGSSITSTTVSQLGQRFKVALDGPINTKPSIVNNRAYIGTSIYGGSGGTLYKVNLCNGCVEGKFPTPNDPAFYSIKGVGGSPAIYGGNAYFTTVSGKVWCVKTSTMTKVGPHPAEVWVTDLKNPSMAKMQPISNPNGDAWASPLVVGNKVYVASGEGESPTCWGFVWCLDANSGEVIWVFCTNKFTDINTSGNDNSPNVIPNSAAGPLPPWATIPRTTMSGFTNPGYTVKTDPPETGSSPWSSIAYDSVLGNVYIGTGNSQYTSSPAGLGSTAPDEHYGSGLIALKANTGQFVGFHTSQADDSYHPEDEDIDVPGAPTIFVNGGKRVVCYGSKNGSFFLLDAATMKVLNSGAGRRQLLPRTGGTGHPGSRGTAISGVATNGSFMENKWGVMATPAIHYSLKKIYIGLGGYFGAGDGTKTPFIRALDMNNLNDAWPTYFDVPDNITKYACAKPPLYIEANEAGLSSPAVVNNVVFVSTTTPNKSEMSLYALDAATGFCLWASAKVSGGGWPNYALGPAISGEYVVNGAGTDLYIYCRPATPWCLKPVLPDWTWWDRPIIRDFPFQIERGG